MAISTEGEGTGEGSPERRDVRLVQVCSGASRCFAAGSPLVWETQVGGSLRKDRSQGSFVSAVGNSQQFQQFLSQESSRILFTKC